MLESVTYRGQHVGVLPNGTVKEPGRTGTGRHAQFVLNIHKSVKVSVIIITFMMSLKTYFFEPVSIC